MPMETLNEEQWNVELQKLKNLLSEHPASGELWLKYAMFLRDEFDNPSKAVHAFEKAQQLLPGKDLGLQIADGLASAGRTEEALQMLDRFLAKTPSAHGFCILGNILF